VLLLLVFLPGIGVQVNGARRWIRFWPSYSLHDTSRHKPSEPKALHRL
jgi:cell division protein FtsW (lipid II flippase)